MEVYSDYLLNEYPENGDSDYMFVNIWAGQVGKPITYSTVDELLAQVEKKTGIKANPHSYYRANRHCWNMAHVQEQLGHTSVQTTINTYTHLTDNDLKRDYPKYSEE